MIRSNDTATRVTHSFEPECGKEARFKSSNFDADCTITQIFTMKIPLIYLL